MKSHSDEIKRNEYIGVSNESAGGLASVQVPQAHGLVPRRGKSELSIRGDHNILNKMVVSDVIVHIIIKD